MQSKRLYIAAPFSLIVSARLLANRLRQEGFEITSMWLSEDPTTTDHSQAANEQRARTDLWDIARADAFVLINPEEFRNSGTGGRHVETGCAMMLHMPIFVLGVTTNVFHSLLPCAPTEGALIAMLNLWRTAT